MGAEIESRDGKNEPSVERVAQASEERPGLFRTGVAISALALVVSGAIRGSLLALLIGIVTAHFAKPKSKAARVYRVALAALLIGYGTMVYKVARFAAAVGDTAEEVEDEIDEQVAALRNDLVWEGPVAYFDSIEIERAEAPNDGAVPTVAPDTFDPFEDLSERVQKLGRVGLERCVKQGEANGSACLTRLAYLDRDKAKSLFESLTRERREGLRDTLAWDEVLPLDEMIAREVAMQESGLFESSRNVTDEPPTPLYPNELFDWQGVTLWFDNETGFFPNEHHHLLYEIAARSRGALDGIHFEEIPPSLEANERHEPYKLLAYLDGKRFEVQAQNYGDWYDVAAVIGFANWMLRQRESDVRVVVSDASDQIVGLLVAPEQAILDAHARGWVQVAGVER